MNPSPLLQNRPWDVLLVGGAAGTGKTSVSYALARHFEVGITEVDDLHLVLETLTTPAQQPLLHYWRTKPDSVEMTAEQIVELHIAVGRVLLPALAAVCANHIESQTPIILEGDYILPEILAQPSPAFNQARVQAIFLHEADAAQIAHNFLTREPEGGEQAGRARVSQLFGEWLRAECGRYTLHALPARPWHTLFGRILQTLPHN